MEETMKKYTLLLCLLAAFIFASGCKLFKKEAPPPEPEPEEETAAVEEEEEEAEEEAEEEEAEEEEEMLVSKEDVEKAAKIYNVLHDDKLKDKAKGEEFKKLLEENEWDLEQYEQLIFDIGRDPKASALYKELQEEE
jgi:hypothetical protein